MTNPLLTDWTTPHQIPPFDVIEEGHFAEAFETALAAARDEIAAIAEDRSAPDFDNTILALERAGALLRRVSAVFYGISGADTTPGLDALQREMSPRLAAHFAEITTDPRLFARIRAVREAGGLGPVEARLTEEYFRDFTRAGAALDEAGRSRLKEISGRLATLSTSFTQNVLADERDWQLDLAETDLEGLPPDLVDALRAAGEARGKPGHVLTLSRSLVVPFLQYSPRRDLREIAWTAWTARGANGGETDTRAAAAEILALREERAKLLGYADFATYKLAPEMAKSPDAVRDLLMSVWEPARAQAEADAERLAAMLHEDGINGALEPWDWRYYSERRRKAEHDFDDAALKPYLTLDAMIAAAFDCATRLFGLEFTEIRPPLYHPDARAWEVRQGERLMGVFIGDYFARPSKRSGAWCSRFRQQSSFDGEVRPIVTNVCNFAKAPAGQATLLTFDDAETLFHEFGHALHHLLSDVPYPSLSGTNVAQDWVELPSQLYEHWLSTPQVLATHARHVETGAPMPADLMARLKAAATYDQGFATVEYIASALVDLDFHTGPAPADPMAQQAETLARVGMPRAIAMRHATPHFQHVFAGDSYAAGYYSYMWSEVMDADAFRAFEETGDVFDEGTAKRLKENVYAAGNTRDPEALYTAFRGALPSVDALLRQRGFAA